MDPRSQPGRFATSQALGGVGAVVLVLVAGLVVDPRVAGWAAHWKRPAFDAVVGLLNPIGSGVTLLMICMALGAACRRLRRSRLHDAAWLAALAFACAGLTEFGLKHLVGRARPDAALGALSLLGPSFTPDVDSFPSGHATSVFAVATVFAAFYPRLSWPLYTLAAAIAAGRVYLGRHYPSDVIAGALIGIVIASCLVRNRRAFRRWRLLHRWLELEPAPDPPA